ncbi:MAG: glycolate oxidase subunit GlcF [Betaproteobacteria bacterium]|nr:glycolate oxidase subunit GlcF [Betaproteobacteria bacterium]MBK7276935.1 glycolate oxidase subunit GlcF [Betaproteobacteria bacterium]MBK9685353.1 glycolate oxidase subunit GlcF [Betaproteobacteria bacterium]MBL0299259.1 glycolate oxidase subunit GlcF [Betaproteobacteria bacterium]
MQTNLSPEFKGTRDGEAAEAILRKCVHCGFCTATCPTYQLLGDELDGPRGRIYLMKQVLEGGEVTRSTQLHLDRCLTCRNCETTCPSGVDYGHLVDIGRKIVEERVQRPAGEKAVRWLLKEGLTSPLFAPAMKMGQLVRPLLPAALKHKVPAPAAPRAGVWPQRQHARKVLMLAGCVQPAMMPNVNSATARVLDAAGIQTLVAAKAGCCGALRTHLNDHEGGLDDMRRNIDAWWPYVESGEVEAIVMNASGCGVAVKEYGHALAHDPDYAEKAARIGALTRDLSELLPDMVPALQSQVRHVGGAGHARRLAFHPPCTLQHGQQLRGGVETHLRALGFEVSLAGSESHLCCGSAGTYSVLQPTLAYQLRDRKLGHLSALEPQAIVSANIGCIQHLQSGTGTPVRHWVEVLDDALAAAA